MHYPFIINICREVADVAPDVLPLYKTVEKLPVCNTCDKVDKGCQVAVAFCPQFGKSFCFDHHQVIGDVIVFM